MVSKKYGSITILVHLIDYTSHVIFLLFKTLTYNTGSEILGNLLSIFLYSGQNVRMYVKNIFTITIFCGIIFQSECMVLQPLVCKIELIVTLRDWKACILDEDG